MEGLWYGWLRGEGASSQVGRQLARSAMKLFGEGLFHQVYIKKANKQKTQLAEQSSPTSAPQREYLKGHWE